LIGFIDESPLKSGFGFRGGFWDRYYDIINLICIFSCMTAGSVMVTMVRTKQDIMNALYENRSRLRDLGVRNIGLFGSFAREEQHSDSDIDLLVEFEPDRKTFDSFMGLSFFLEEVLQHRVEVVTVESLSPYLGPYILKEVEYATLSA